MSQQATGRNRKHNKVSGSVRKLQEVSGSLRKAQHQINNKQTNKQNTVALKLQVDCKISTVS